MTDSKKTDTKTQWSDDDYEVDRCHHILKLLAYASVVGLLIICIGIGIAILVNQNGGATTITSVRSKSSPPKVPPTLKQEEVHVPEPPKDNQLVAQAEDLNPAGRLVPPKSPMAKVPACEPALVFTPPQIKLVGTISSHVSPDPADGSFNLFTLNLTMTIINANISQPLLDGNRLVINVSEPYRANWPQLDGLGRTWSVQHLSGNHHRYSLSITASAKNVQPGFYENLTLAVSQIRTLNPKLSCPMVLLHYIKVSIDVTCSATILDKWCDGERRWIPKSNKCVKTYKPCGQELTVGVPNTNPCTRYACYNNNRTCSQVPLGGIGSGQCDSCTPVSICTPNCTNIYNEQGGITGDLIRYCGDDGCGGICGIPDTANGCDPVGIAHSCDALFGKCVASTLGSCSLPYNLFMGSIAVGNPRLNALDLDGLQSWVLTNNDTSTTDPIHLVTADDPLTLGNELSPWNAVYGWPLDERTVPLQGIRVRIFLNSFYYPDTITNSDNAPGTSDVNFKFTVAPGQIRAMEAYICGQDGDTSNGGRDTFLALVREDCTEFNTTDINFTPADQYQGNDSNPPGGYCSRILSTGLQGGLNGRNFTIVATTYSQNNAGPLWLEVVFTNSTQGPCTPICEGHKCGSNGCGGVCNIVTCANGLSCNSGTCSDCPVNPPNCLHPPNSNFPAPYNGTYYQAECGEDLHHCGDSCGTCPTGSYCQLEMGICIPVAFCDHNVPKCSRPYPAPQRTKRDTFAGKEKGKEKQYFCNTMCEWQELNDPLPDIIPNGESMVLPTYLMHWKTFDSLSCTFDEKCVFGVGERLILRFNTDIMNVGTATFHGVDIFGRPDLALYSQCHQHYHMRGFAQHVIVDNTTGLVLIESSKQSYCVESSMQYQFGPKVPCTSDTTCDNQGLEPGMLDRYDKYLDCQWLDVTGLVETQNMNKWHLFFVSVNNGRPIVEYSYVNNQAQFPVFIPCPPTRNVQIEPFTIVQANPQYCCNRPGGYDDFACPDFTNQEPNICSWPQPSPSECSYIIP